MLKQPRQSHYAAADVVLTRNRIDCVTQLNSFCVAWFIQINRTRETEAASRQRTPGERRDLVHHALLHRSVPEIIQAQQTDLDLVHPQLERAGFLNKREKRR